MCFMWCVDSPICRRSLYNGWQHTTRQYHVVIASCAGIHGSQTGEATWHVSPAGVMPGLPHTTFERERTQAEPTIQTHVHLDHSRSEVSVAPSKHVHAAFDTILSKRKWGQLHPAFSTPCQIKHLHGIQPGSEWFAPTAGHNDLSVGCAATTVIVSCREKRWQAWWWPPTSTPVAWWKKCFARCENADAIGDSALYMCASPQSMKCECWGRGRHRSSRVVLSLSKYAPTCICVNVNKHKKCVKKESTFTVAITNSPMCRGRAVSAKLDRASASPGPTSHTPGSSPRGESTRTRPSPRPAPRLPLLVADGTAPCAPPPIVRLVGAERVTLCTAGCEECDTAVALAMATA